MKEDWARYTARWRKQYLREKPERTAAQNYDSDEEETGMEAVRRNDAC